MEDCGVGCKDRIGQEGTGQDEMRRDRMGWAGTEQDGCDGMEQMGCGGMEWGERM